MAEDVGPTGIRHVVWTAVALADLDDILTYTAANHPETVAPLERRIRAVLQRIARWPESATPLEERSDVRVVPLVRYPFRVFYRVLGDRVEILHLHHAARR